MKAKLLTTLHPHTTQTTCLRIGQKSGQVLVTGGLDKTVNLFKIGASEALLVTISNMTMNYIPISIAMANFNSHLQAMSRL